MVHPPLQRLLQPQAHGVAAARTRSTNPVLRSTCAACGCAELQAWALDPRTPRCVRQRALSAARGRA